MKLIPTKLREILSTDPYYKRCCITGQTTGKIDWHHNLIFGGSQVNERWCILPLHTDIHKEITRYKELCNWIMLNRASDQELERVSKVIDYKLLKTKLNNTYGIYRESNTENYTRLVGI